MKSIDVAISFDTTGSMYPCITEVRRKLSGMVSQLFSKIPNLRVAVVAHGDYCDHPRVIETLDFSDDTTKIIKFINNVRPTGGGDADECYEYVLHKVRSLNWLSDKSRALVMVGDADPHRSGYQYGSYTATDWKNEASLLAAMDVKIYSCHAMSSIRRSSVPFYSKLAEIGNGVYLTLDQFASLPLLLIGVFYAQNDFNQLKSYAEQLESSGELSRDLHTSFTGMGVVSLKPMAAPTMSFARKTTTVGISTSAKIPAELAAVPASRFQIFRIDTKESIRNFVERQSIAFRPGRGFYQLAKSVKVQQYKEIILVHKVTKDIYTGAPVREMLGLQPQTAGGGVVERLSSHSFLDAYDVFIQSTSYNRELLPNTLFMYEVDGWDADLYTRTLKEEVVAKPVATSVKKTKTSPEVVVPKKKETPEKSVKVEKPFTDAPVSSGKGPALFSKAALVMKYRKKYPALSWADIAELSGYGSASGARKAYMKYAEPAK